MENPCPNFRFRNGYAPAEVRVIGGVPVKLQSRPPALQIAVKAILSGATWAFMRGNVYRLMIERSCKRLANETSERGRGSAAGLVQRARYMTMEIIEPQLAS